MHSPPNRSLPWAASLAGLLALLAVPCRAADAQSVLLVVPAGSEMAQVEAARAAVPPSRTLLVVGGAERIPLREGLELVADRTFVDAPASDLVVVLAGEAPGEQEFLSARRRTARAILFLGDSPLVSRLKGNGSRGALILVGKAESIAPLAGATGAPASAMAEPGPSPTPRLPAVIATPRPSSPTPRPTPASAVQRYFSARRPTPTPPPQH